MTRDEIVGHAHARVIDLLEEATEGFGEPDAALLFLLCVAAGLEAYVKACAPPAIVANTRAALESLSDAFSRKLLDRARTIEYPSPEQPQQS